MGDENNVAVEPKKKSKKGLIIALIAGGSAAGLFAVIFLVIAIILISTGGYKGALRKYFRVSERGNGNKIEAMRLPVDIEIPELQVEGIEDLEWEVVYTKQLSKDSKDAQNLKSFRRSFENMYGRFGFKGDKVRTVYRVDVEVEGEVAGADREGTFTYYVYKYGTKWYVWDGGYSLEYMLMTRGQDN